MQQHWDIFCRVIDNYGDIGVCWRLARQLAAEHGLAVRLWLDDLASLQGICPALDCTQASQQIAGVNIVHWIDEPAIGSVGAVVIEAFACELPANYVNAMAAAKTRPVWINLEYLTAENWADSCHGLASPHPSLPLVKYFFFPGFSPATGGLLRERGLLDMRRTEVAQLAPSKTLEISLFCYETAPVAELIDCLAESPSPVLCHVPPGKPLAAVRAHLGGTGPWQIGQLFIQPQSFLALDDYDRLLWRCTINFVRGEDSFLRAQWAGRPFVWQIYAQDDAAHLIKLDAFLERYTAALEAPAKAAVRALYHAWNDGRGIASAWADFLALHRQLQSHAIMWAEQLATAPDLASTLVKFCQANV